MKAFLVFTLYLVILQQIVVVQSKDNSIFPKLEECGILNVDYFYNKQTVTEFDEYPWIARVAFDNLGEIQYKCLGVLISKRCVLTVAQCSRKEVPYAVVLGDWDMSNNVTEKDCNANGDCAPLPVQYEIEEVVVHPGFTTSQKGTNDIALIRLTTDVTFTDHIQPICMPPLGGYATDLVPHYFNAVGFDYLRLSSYGNNIMGRPERIKSLVQVLDKEHCVKPLNSKPTFDNVICTTCVSNISFVSGSALMGVLVENSKPSRFYLLGLMSAGGYSDQKVCAPTAREIFSEVSSHISWIKYNMYYV